MFDKTVYIFSDGACSGNPGPGGYGAILRCGDREKEISGGEAHTTNNRMELCGVIAGLEALKKPCRVILQTDSRYVVDGITKGWAKSWRKNGWIKSDKKPAINSDLWERLLDLLEILAVSGLEADRKNLAGLLFSRVNVGRFLHGEAHRLL